MSGALATKFSEETFLNKSCVLSTVLWKRNVSRCPRHGEGCVFDPRFDGLDVVFVGAGAWHLRFLKRLQATINLWHRILGCYFSGRQMYEILLQVCTRALGLPHHEVLLHTLVARFLPLVILIVKAMLWRRVVSLALVAHRINLMRIIFRSWNLWKLFLIREVAFGTISYEHFMMRIIPRFACICTQSILHRLILVRYLHIQLVDAGWNYESLLMANAILLIRVWPVRFRWVAGGWWRCQTFEVDIATREPRLFSPVMQIPRGLISILR